MFIETLTGEQAKALLHENYNPMCTYRLVSDPDRFVINEQSPDGTEKEFLLDNDIIDEEVMETHVFPTAYTPTETHTDYQLPLLLLFLIGIILFLVFKN